MNSGTDVIVVGAGVVGLAHALQTVRQGRSLRVIERHATPIGASVRNFGMVWPIGQPRGLLLELANRSRSVWLELASEIGFECRQTGSLILAHADDEQQVLEEFVDREKGGSCGRQVRLLDTREARDLVPSLRAHELRGAVHSETEVGIDPREAIAEIWRWIGEQAKVVKELGTATLVEGTTVSLSDGRVFEGDEIFICSGDDAETLFPGLLAEAGLYKSKLQMLRVVAQPAGWNLDVHLAAGLTLPRMSSFADCPGVPLLRERQQRDFPEYMKNGIQILVAQIPSGELVIGDSHHFGGEALEPFDSREIERLVLEYSNRMIAIPDRTVSASWHGVYTMLSDRRFLVARPEDRVTLVNGLGGAGLTLSFGLAERVIDRDPRIPIS